MESCLISRNDFEPGKGKDTVMILTGGWKIKGREGLMGGRREERKEGGRDRGKEGRTKGQTEGRKTRWKEGQTEERIGGENRRKEG